MIDKDSNEVFDIKCQKCTQCGTWYATCHSQLLGKVTQWGASEMEAIKNLQKYIVDIWQEKWPENQSLDHDAKNRRRSAKSLYCLR